MKMYNLLFIAKLHYTGYICLFHQVNKIILSKSDSLEEYFDAMACKSVSIS